MWSYLCKAMHFWNPASVLPQFPLQVSQEPMVPVQGSWKQCIYSQTSSQAYNLSAEITEHWYYLTQLHKAHSSCAGVLEEMHSQTPWSAATFLQPLCRDHRALVNLSINTHHSSCAGVLEVMHNWNPVASCSFPTLQGSQGVGIPCISTQSQ